MLKNLYLIGKAIQREYPEYATPWQNPFPKLKEGQKAKVVVVEVNQGEIAPQIRVEEFRDTYLDKYLYRKVDGTNGTNLVPTFFYNLSSKVDKEKWEKEQITLLDKLIKKIKNSIKKNKHDFLGFDKLPELKALLLAASKHLSLKNRYLFTMRINGKYFGEYPEYQELFREKAYLKYYGKSKGRNQVCAVTYEVVDEVWGGIDTLGFTVDKKAFNRNGFDGKKSYKMLGVAPKVAKVLDGAKSFVSDNLTNRFYNLQYFILPHFIHDDEGIIQEVMHTFLEAKDRKTFTSEGNAIIHNETILKEIAEEENLQHQIYYDLFFYEQNQNQLLIKLQLSDVLPSQIKKIFDLKEQVEEDYRELTTYKYKEEVKHFYITFAAIAAYFSKAKKKNEYIFHPYFFKVLEAVFYNSTLKEEEILKAFIKTIRTAFKNRKDEDAKYQYLTTQSFVIYQFFLRLNLFKNKKYMEKSNQTTENSALDDFILKHPTFFDSEYKKGIFRMGALTKILLKKQYQKLKNEPFMKNLYSLNLDENKIMELLPKLINKLREYDVGYTAALETEIAKALVSPSTMSKTEISYAFTLGMIMQSEFGKQDFENWKEEQE